MITVAGPERSPKPHQTRGLDPPQPQERDLHLLLATAIGFRDALLSALGQAIRARRRTA